MPVVYVKDTSGNIIHIEEGFTSVVWTERYQENGEFVLDIPLSEARRDVYQEGNYIFMDDSDFYMIIEKVEIQDDVEKPNFEVSGRTLSCVLERRLNASRAVSIVKNGITTYSGDFEEIVSQLIKDEITEPKIEYIDYYRDESTQEWKERIESKSAPERAIPNFAYSNLAPVLSIDKSFTEVKTVYDILVSFSKPNLTGFKVDLDSNGSLKLVTYKGTDHTTGQYTNSPLIFSPVMDNVTYMNSYSDITDYKTIALSMEDSTGLYQWVDNPNSDSTKETGLNRREVLFTVSTSTSSEESGEETQEDPLLAAALDEFESGDYDIVSISEGAIDPLVRYGIDADYYIGDIVDVVDHFGHHYYALIDEVVRSYDDSGYIVTPNFKSMEDYDYGEEDLNGS